MNYERSGLEHLVTDGRGGFFCGTASGMPTRFWHGWWTARRPPRDRELWLSGIEESFRNEAGETFALTPRWRDGAWRDAEVRSSYAKGVVTRTLHRGLSLRVAPHLSGEGPEALRLRVELQSGDPHARGWFLFRPVFPYVPTIRRRGPKVLMLAERDRRRLLLMAPEEIEVTGERIELRDVDFDFERDCEDDWTRTLYTGPQVAVPLRVHQPADIVFILQRGEEVVKPTHWLSADLVDPERFTGPLHEAAGQFLVTTQSGRRTILAGYPWFTDWGRDAMIALPGLCVRTGRLSEAEEIIEHFLEHAREGLIPNLFPEQGEEPMYNTIDGTLWLFEAGARLDEALRAKGERWITPERLARLREIIDWHIRGTKNDIRVDESDGLLAGGSPGSQLTWMDVKVNGHVPTPRHCKPVEIQGLWYNALRVTAEWCEQLGKTGAEQLRVQAERCRKSVAARFFDEKHPHAADVVDRDGAGTADWSLRPNMVIPFALRHNVLPEEKRAALLRETAAHLLTPRGLRTLDPRLPEYHGIYRGPREERDRAYHQGTAWMWLLMPYARGVVRHREEVPELAAGLKNLRRELLRHFSEEACAAQASEIADGDPPHAARGCFAQAWSTAAVIEVDALVREEL